MALATATGVMGESRNDRTRWPKQPRLFTVKRAPPSITTPPPTPPLIQASNTFRGVEMGLVCVTRVSFNDVTLCWCR